MTTQFDQFMKDKITKNQEEIDHVVADYLGSFAPHMIYFESSWANDLYCKQTIKPFLDHIDNLIPMQPPVNIGHKYFENGEQLRYYLQWPDGLAWKNNMMWGNKLTVVGCHGYPSGLHPTLGLIPHNELQDIFLDYGSDCPSVLYFSSCNLFQDEQKARELLEASKVCGLFGFKGEIGYISSVVLDLLLISTFFMVGLEHDPTQHLTEIYEIVRDSFLPAREAGFSLFLA